MRVSSPLRQVKRIDPGGGSTKGKGREGKGRGREHKVRWGVREEGEMGENETYFHCLFFTITVVITIIIIPAKLSSLFQSILIFITLKYSQPSPKHCFPFDLSFFPTSGSLSLSAGGERRWWEAGIEPRRKLEKEEGEEEEQGDDWMKVISKWANQREGGSQVAWCTGANYLKDSCSEINGPHPKLPPSLHLIRKCTLSFCLIIVIIPYIFFFALLINTSLYFVILNLYVQYLYAYFYVEWISKKWKLFENRMCSFVRKHKLLNTLWCSSWISWIYQLTKFPDRSHSFFSVHFAFALCPFTEKHNGW